MMPITRPILKIILFVMIFAVAPHSVAAEVGTCLRIEHPYSYGGSVGWTYNGYYDFSIYDPVKGTSTNYGVLEHEAQSVFAYETALSDDGKYVSRFVNRGTSENPIATFIITATGIDRHPLLEIDLSSYDGFDDIDNIWLPDSQHVLLMARNEQRQTLLIMLADIGGKFIKKEIETSDNQSVKYITTAQDNTRLIVFVQDILTSATWYEIWSTRDLNVLGSFSLPDDVVYMGYQPIPMIAWRPGADEFAYLREADKKILVVFVAPFEPTTKAIVLPGNANDFNLTTDYYPEIEWSPDGRYLSILLNETDEMTLSHLHLVDAQTKPYQLKGNVSTRVAMANCAGGCPGPRVRWRKDSQALHFLEKSQANVNGYYGAPLVAYYPAEQRYQILTEDAFYAPTSDTQEELLLVEHRPANANFSLQYMTVDGSVHWTAIQSSHVAPYYFPSPDFHKVAAFDPTTNGVGIYFANYDTQKSFQATFGNKKVDFGVWSADNRLIAFRVIDDVTETVDIGVANVETGIAQIVVHDLKGVENGIGISIQIASNGQLGLYTIKDKSTYPNPTMQVRMFRANGTEIPLNLPLFKMEYSYSPVIRWSANSTYFAVWDGHPDDNRHYPLFILRNDGTILHEFKDTPRPNRDAEFVWIPCDQPLLGWQPRAPLDFPRWP